MSGHSFDTVPARARPVADAPAEPLSERAEELARRWAFALLASHPLAEMTAVPLEEIARHAPALCASAARALASEEELAAFAPATAERGAPSPAAALSALAAGWDASEAVEHVEALRRVLWEAMLEVLTSPSPREVADLADRLSSVCAALTVAALAQHAAGEGAPRARSTPPGQALHPAPAGSGAVLIDELDELVRPSRSPRPAAPTSPSEPFAGRSAAGLDARRTAPRPLPWDIPLQGGAPSATATPAREDADSLLRVSRGPVAPGEDPAR